VKSIRRFILFQKVLSFLLIISIASALGFTYLKIFVQPPFGPLGILLLSLLILFSIFLIFSLYLYKLGRKQTLAKIWMSFFALFFTYFIAELTLSLLFVNRLSPKIIPDQYRHHKLATNSRWKIQTKEYRYVETVNHLGLRGRDIQLDFAHHNFRILMLGDSFTMGKGVADDKTFSAILETSLRQKNKNVEVLNGGVDSYSPILSYFQLTVDLKDLHPDLVVLNLDMSDLVQEAVYRKNAIYNAQGEILRIEGRRRLTLRIKHWIDHHLYLSRFIIFNLNKPSEREEILLDEVIDQANKELLRHTLAEDTQDRTAQWNNIFDSILKMKSYCDAQKIEFLLTIYPWGHQVSDKEWAAGRSAFLPKKFHVSDRSVQRVVIFSENNNVQLLNLFPAFRSYKGKSHLYYTYDMHWTEAGHQLAAHEFEKWLNDSSQRRKRF
jgi:hypothetical protein